MVGSWVTASPLSVPLFFVSMLSILSVFLAVFFKACLPLIALIALIDLATMSRPRRVRLLRRQGLTWQQIADRYGVKSPSTPARWAAA
jgi:predicted membrane protein